MKSGKTSKGFAALCLPFPFITAKPPFFIFTAAVRGFSAIVCFQYQTDRAAVTFVQVRNVPVIYFRGFRLRDIHIGGKVRLVVHSVRAKVAITADVAVHTISVLYDVFVPGRALFQPYVPVARHTSAPAPSLA